MKTPGFWFRPPGLAASLLKPLGRAYYWLGQQRKASPAPLTTPLIVVGNVVAGGAGKTPVVIALARLLRERGLKVHLMAKGYGGSLKGPLEVNHHHTAAEVGDEPLLLLRHAPTFIGQDRGATYQLAAQHADVVISDDGLQSPRLAPSLALLVLDGVLGFGNGQLIPAGPLREPVDAALQRVQAVVQVGGHARPFGKTPVLMADFMPFEYDWLKGARVIGFAGIGQPEKFFSTLSTCGATVVAAYPYGDHQPYTEAEIRRLLKEADEAEAILVTTTKDAVRIPTSLREQVRVVDGTLVWRNPAAVDDVLKVMTPK